MEREVRISISTRTLVMAVVVGILAWSIFYLRNLVLLVITAIVLASAIQPGVHFFMRYKMPRILAVLAMYFAVFGTVFGIAYFFLPPVLSEAAGFIAQLPQYLETVDLPATSLGAATSHFLGGDSNALTSSLTSIQQAVTNTSSGAIRLIATFFGGIFSFVLVFVLSFYFAVNETGVEDFLRIIVPLSQEDYIVSLWHRSQKKIGLWMQGQILLSLLAAILVYLGLLIIGVPYPLLLAVLTALCEVIPIFGSFIAGGVSVAVAWTSGGAALAFIVAGLFIVVNQFEANLIYPLVVKKIVGVPPLLVIVALIAGSELAGFLGVFLSVPIAAIVQEFVSDLDRERRAHHARVSSAS